MTFCAKLVKFPVTSTETEILVLSNNEKLTLSLIGRTGHVFSIVDKNDEIVRTAHSWLSYLSSHASLTNSLGTAEQYGRTLSYLCRWIEKSPISKNCSIDEVICSLSRYEIIEWIRYMEMEGAESRSTLRSRETCLKQFLDWLTTLEGGKEREIVNSPWGLNNELGYIVKAPHAKSPKFITAEIIVQLLNQLHNECERCMFHTQYDTGLRISELINLKLKDLPRLNSYDSDHEFIPIYIHGVKGIAGQTKERVTLISRAVLNRIKSFHSSLGYKLAPDWAINDPDKPVFLSSNQLPWSIRNASKQFKSAVRRSNVGERFKTHWMRHGTAFSVLRSDIGKSYEDRILTIKAMLGHAKLSTTEIYTQISPALLTKLTEKGKELNRLDEAEYIRSKTYLPPLKHIERRGHHSE